MAREREVDKSWRFCQSRRGGEDSQARPYFHGDVKEVRVKEARVETKEELEGGEVKEEACRSVATWLERGRGSDRRSG